MTPDPEQFFHDNGALPWQPGVVDCCMAPADWVVARGYRDPAADLRETYHTESECHQIIARAGGLIKVMTGRLRKVRWFEADDVEDGALGVIGSETDIYRQWAAIAFGGRWYVRFDRGFHGFIARPLMVWRP